MGNPSDGPAAVTWLNVFCIHGYYGYMPKLVTTGNRYSNESVVVYDRNSSLLNIQKHFTVSKISQKFCKTEMVNLLLLWTESAINSIFLWNRNRKN